MLFSELENGIQSLQPVGALVYPGLSFRGDELEPTAVLRNLVNVWGMSDKGYRRANALTIERPETDIREARFRDVPHRDVDIPLAERGKPVGIGAQELDRPGSR